jgi:predicted acylesterase/phospholipase RssA
MSARGSQVHKPHRKTHQVQERPPFDCVALLLQGGGALGAYQAGVYEALAEAHLHPDWVAGISIGAINSALIAGNPPEARVEKLRAFWQLITALPVWGAGLFPIHPDAKSYAGSHQPRGRRARQDGQHQPVHPPSRADDSPARPCPRDLAENGRRCLLSLVSRTRNVRTAGRLRSQPR